MGKSLLELPAPGGHCIDMIWFLAIYFIGLFYIAVFKPDRIRNRDNFREAWISFAVIPMLQMFFTLFRAGNHRPEELMQIEFWQQGLTGLLLSTSLFKLLGALVPARSYDSSKMPDDSQAQPGRSDEDQS